jgi:hypothetical protein
MKRTAFVIVISLSFFATAARAEQLDFLPAGMLLTCTLDEPRLTTKTAAKDDPVICLLQNTGFGRGTLPHGSFLTGKLQDSKKPGRFVGKGWINLEFDRLVMPGVGSIDLTSKVAGSTKYKVDSSGKIDGKGHATRDTVEWLTPPLIPVKLVTLPARGPEITLTDKTKITVRLMEDVQLPPMPATTFTPSPRDRTASMSPISYLARSPQEDGRPLVLIMRDQSMRAARRFWVEDSKNIRWLDLNGRSWLAPISEFDLYATLQANGRF